MITRAKLVEQLREHQIRSAQSYSAALSVFSPNPHIASRRDLKVALPLCRAVLFSHGVVLCCTLPEMVQTFIPPCIIRNPSSSMSQNLSA